ncbi:hypothetical protein IWZ03DRAFT_214802 [Phyllosticta citriasiana]|uniref:Secreted protein n=1 Tax=Phyllosticta citriasiana TaxID=595635 RepID=A0ABR1KGE2_9PEZI
MAASFDACADPRTFSFSLLSLLLSTTRLCAAKEAASHEHATFAHVNCTSRSESLARRQPPQGFGASFRLALRQQPPSPPPLDDRTQRLCHVNSFRRRFRM